MVIDRLTIGGSVTSCWKLYEYTGFYAKISKKFEFNRNCFKKWWHRITYKLYSPLSYNIKVEVLSNQITYFSPSNDLKSIFFFLFLRVELFLKRQVRRVRKDQIVLNVISNPHITYTFNLLISIKTNEYSESIRRRRKNVNQDSRKWLQYLFTPVSSAEKWTSWRFLGLNHAYNFTNTFSS